MKKTLLGATLACLLAVPAMASDLYRPAPPAPVVPTLLPNYAFSPSAYYAGLSGGAVGTIDNLDKIAAGGFLGVRWAALGLEADYDRIGFGAKGRNLLTGNLTVEQNLAFAGLPKITPYVLGGLGAALRHEFDRPRAIAVFGAGTRYAITHWTDVDFRYRRAETLGRGGRAFNVFSTGVSFKF